VEGRSSSSPAPGENNRARLEDVVDALRAGDEEAFVELVRLYGPAMLRVARLYVSSRAVAEEVVQETWLAVLTGIASFERRSSFSTWLFRILTNQAKTRAVQEGRSVAFSAMSGEEVAADEPSVEPDRFRGTAERFAHHWTSSPARWELPEATVLSKETVTVVEQAIDSLPPAQRAVITLRDIVGCDAEEVCDALEISPANQRVLLHRARTKVRKALEHHLSSV
jgi:RNA polymerase sigma-70 factor (ECF subfamily)